MTFSHTIFALPFALIGFFIGMTSHSFWKFLSSPGKYKLNFTLDYEHEFRNYPKTITELILRFILVIACMIFARSAAMAFNRWLDANFDAKNPRTAIREIPAGIIKANYALLFVILNCIAFIICCWYINRICFYLSFVALLVVLFYSYTKRFTALCHLVLGIGLSLAPIGAYLSVTGTFHLLPLLFSFTVLFWVSGFDIIYALQDEVFDRENKLHSIPVAVGPSKALRISEALHLFSASCVVLAGVYGSFGAWYWMGVIFFICLLIYQHLLVKPTDLSKINKAFFTTNGIASVVFSVFVLIDVFRNGYSLTQ